MSFSFIVARLLQNPFFIVQRVIENGKQVTAFNQWFYSHLSDSHIDIYQTSVDKIIHRMYIISTICFRRGMHMHCSMINMEKKQSIQCIDIRAIFASS